MDLLAVVLDVVVVLDAASDEVAALDVVACDEEVHGEGHVDHEAHVVRELLQLGRVVGEARHHQASSYEVHSDQDHLGHHRRNLLDADLGDLLDVVPSYPGC